MIRAYTYKLYPNKKIEAKFNQWLGVTRYVYNLAKETKETSYKYGVQVSAYDLIKQLTECKKENSWINQVNAHTLQAVIEQLDNTFRNFFSKRAKYPKWASKKVWKSFGFKQSNLVNTHPSLRFEEDGRFNLPKFGKVRVYNPRLLNERHIKTARLIKKIDGIYLSVIAEVEDKQYCFNESQVGIDMGIRYFCVTSEGEYIDNPRFLEKQLKKLRVERRSLSRKKKGSNRRNKQVNVVAKLYKNITDARNDFIHKQSTYIASNYSNVAIEDLNIKEMVKENLSLPILDASWGTFFRMLKYKCNNLVKVNPAYSSQECSKCGYTCKENRVTQSIFKCVKCGHEDNADLDAAKVIEARAFANSRQREAVVCA